MSDPFAPVDWKLRSEEFGSLQQVVRSIDRFVVMELVSPGIDDPGLVEPLWDLWLGLPHHPCVLQPVEKAAHGRLLVRYAALDWKHKPLRVDEPGASAAMVATWGITFTRIYDFINMLVADTELGWLACPFVKIDLTGAARVGFVSPAGSAALMNRVAPEVVAAWPRADERALVFAIGQLLLSLIDVTRKTKTSPLGTVVMRCLEAAPPKRFQTLEELRHALAVVGGKRNMHLEMPPHLRDSIEKALGLAALDLHTAALVVFRDVLYDVPDYPVARAGEQLMLERGADPVAGQSTPRQRHLNSWTISARLIPAKEPRTLDWQEIRPVGRKLEDEGRYAEAIGLYNRVSIDGPHAAEILIATARAHLGAREYGIAVDFARRALVKDPGDRDALEIAARAWFSYRRYHDALAAVDRWLEVAPSSGDAHYLRAKVLLALGRLAEARDECQRATELGPRHLAAMMLRRQIDRSMKRVRSTVGTSGSVPIDLPEHLRHLRELLVSGRTAEAITILAAPEYAGDAVAQLLRGDLLLFSDRLDDALAVFEHAATLAPAHALAAKLGKATVLVRLGRAEEALTSCDALVREYPGASEPHEGRAQALQALGRSEEADAAFKQALAAGAQRSEARVKLAGR